MVVDQKVSEPSPVRRNRTYVKRSDQPPSVDQGCRNERGEDMSQTSRLARQVTLDEAWSSSAHSEICCLIYATQNGWKLPILFEEIAEVLVAIDDALDAISVSFDEIAD